jgi:hypothetical protein
MARNVLEDVYFDVSLGTLGMFHLLIQD